MTQTVDAGKIILIRLVCRCMTFSAMLAVGLFCVPNTMKAQAEEPIIAFSGTNLDFGGQSSCPPGYGLGPGGGPFPSSQPRIWQPTGSGTFGISGGTLYANTFTCTRPFPFDQIKVGPALGSAAVNSQTSFSLANGEIVFEGLVTAQVYQCTDTGCTPGMPAPDDIVSVGLANGTDRSNVIEIVGFSATGSVTCRTVTGGEATETQVTLSPVPPNSFGPADEYEIVAKAGVVNFYINGNLVATHTTDIPTTPLNALFLISSNGGTSNNESAYLADVQFKRLPQ